MLTKKIKCPKCKNQLSINGENGEKKDIVCPKCSFKGVFTFPLEKKEISTKKNSYIIEVKKLTKKFNNFIAVDNVSFNIKSGEIFGFLGPNGAGKTTTIKSILGLIQTNSGEIKINGYNIKNKGKEAKKNIGYLPEKVAFYDNLTAFQNLNFYAEMKNVSKEECEPLIKEFGLEDSINKKVGKFSKGMIQRLGMARAILGNPPILILDEPTGGLDPRGVVYIRKRILEMKEKGATIFISSHILSEIQEVCDRVGIINKGTLVAKDTVSELSKKMNIKPKIIIELENISDKIVESVKKVKGVDKAERIGRSIDVVCESKIKSKVIVAIEKAGGNIVNLYTKEPSLEEVFMRFTEEKK
jgi:ABC-type multidrug transport system ATPase subunit